MNSAPGQVKGVPEVLATYPTGTFLENLEAQPDGSILFTSYFAKQILRWTPAGNVTFATLNVHPVDFVTTTRGVIVAAHGKPFNSGSDFVETMQIVLLDADGGVRSTTAVSEARFLNGMIPFEAGRFLIADSLAGVVWAYEQGNSEVTPWLSHEALKPVTGPNGEFALGANGIKIFRGHLYFSNSSTTTLYRIRLEGADPAGEVETVAKLNGIDDFAIEESGRIFAATHRNEIVMIDTQGRVTVIADKQTEGATAVAFGLGPSAGHLFVTTTGGLFAGLKANANLLRMPVPDP